MADGQAPLPQEQPAQDPSADMAQGISQVGEALSSLQQGLANVSPELSERMAAVVQEFQAIISEASQVGGQAPQGPQGGTGVVSPEGGAGGVPLPQ